MTLKATGVIVLVLALSICNILFPIAFPDELFLSDNVGQKCGHKPDLPVLFVADDSILHLLCGNSVLWCFCLKLP